MGRPHVPVDLNTARHVVAAVHIAVPYTTIALLDLRGRVIVERRTPHPATDPVAIVDRAAGVLAALLDGHCGTATPLGLGVATGGRVDQDSGTAVEHPMLGWQDVPLRQLFAERTGLPVYVDGHSRALLQGERLFGAARGHDSALLLFIGNVVDAAFAADGRVHYGPRSQAGAIAHLPLDGNTERCPCGRAGCLQVAVSDETLARRAFGEGVTATPDFAVLLEIAQRGDPAAVRFFAERARWVGQATAMLLDVFDPGVVVVVEPGVMFLPGGLATLHSAVQARIRSSLDVTRTVVTTIFSRDILAIAAGSVLLDALYRDPLALLARDETLTPRT
jgi:predicted NBD/HSP70 family sugar kinase